MLGIGRKQSMQERGSAARQADDKKRFANFLRGNFGMQFAIVLHRQAIAQCADNVATKRDFSDDVEPRLALT